MSSGSILHKRVLRGMMEYLLLQEYLLNYLKWNRSYRLVQNIDKFEVHRHDDKWQFDYSYQQTPQ